MLLVFIISCVLGSIETYNNNHSEYAAYYVGYLIVLNLQITMICGILSYYVDLLRRNQYSFYKNVEIKLENASNILGYLLPAFVKKRVTDGVRYIAEDKGTVSVLFCDICDFDKIVAEYSPQELTFFLDELFEKLDKICESVGVSKIETVGKTYLACAGLKDSDRELNSALVQVPHARRAVEMGLSILRETMKIKLKNGDMLKVKIGINSGPVTAGVVGYHKPQFSLVGDTVNTASRMSSTLTEYNVMNY
jgi:class 3 adenylate cyclase